MKISKRFRSGVAFVALALASFFSTDTQLISKASISPEISQAGGTCCPSGAICAVGSIVITFTKRINSGMPCSGK